MLPVNPAKLAEEYKAATALHKAGRLDAAKARYEGIARVAPALAEVPFQLGRIALAKRAPAEAKIHLERARSLKPDEPAILAALADALARLGETEDALALHDAVIAAQPKAVKPRAEKALLLQQTGDFDGAEQEFRKALKLAPLDGELYRIFLGSKKLAKGDPLIRDMQRAWRDPKLPRRSRSHLGFALAKAMADSGQHDKVFAYLHPANAERRKDYPPDMEARRQEVDGLIAAFTGADFTPIAGGPEDFAPIVVTGMPRSGTTLVEQILAAHPQVTAGGEMAHALALAYRTMGAPGAFAQFDSLDATALAGFATAYRDAVRAQHRFDRIVTDKSIQTHLILGMVAKALPDARLIVVRRDPRDLGLSIYRNSFAEGKHRYASSLADIGAYIATFERMVAFWRQAIPGRFTEVRYEDLVAEPEAQTRALVAAAGLDWDEACLDFHSQMGRVQTLSLHQVRQPIYRSSAMAWERHAKDLAPLIDVLHREGVLTDAS